MSRAQLPNPDTPLLALDGRSMSQRWILAFGNLIAALAERWDHSVIPSGQGATVETGAATYTARPWECVSCDPTLAALSVYLPDKAPDGARVAVANVTGSGASAITVYPSAATSNTDTVRRGASDAVGTVAAVYSYDAKKRDWIRTS